MDCASAINLRHSARYVAHYECAQVAVVFNLGLAPGLVDAGDDIAVSVFLLSSHTEYT